MSNRLLPTPLHYVEMVARLGSIQRTARELNIAASAVNRHILMLENELGVQLFERLPRGMRPTQRAWCAASPLRAIACVSSPAIRTIRNGRSRRATAGCG